jgi:mono/diheme cytochrome c family protein
MRRTFFFCPFVFSLSLFFLTAAQSAEPTLTIRAGEKKIVFTTSELLKRSDVVTVTINKDPPYPGKPTTYRAIKVANLFKNIKVPEGSVILYKSIDGFNAPLPQEELLNTSPDKSIAYVAIEPPEKKWPAMTGIPHKTGRPSAGPFYLIWTNPELSGISPEEYVFMLIEFEVQGSMKEEYPDIFPSEALAPDHPAQKGLKLYVTNCFPCHTINYSGTSEFGPDMNVPMNPTEYMTEDALRQFNRDPQSVRYWPQGRMYGFPEDVISEREMDDLIAYLKHMATRKVKRKKGNGPPKALAPPTQKPDAAAGKANYDKLCASCHGATGKGDGPVASGFKPKLRDLSNARYMQGMTDDFMAKVTKMGGISVGQSPIMPAYGSSLSDQDIWNIVAYIRSLAK